jgi:mRNA interferase MazF
VRERGDVVLVNLDPVVGSEVGKTRPAIVLQNEMANRTSPTVTVIPLSTKVDRVFPFQVRIPAGEGGLERESKALCEQIRTLSTQRIHQRLGSLPPDRIMEIRAALDRHLWF